MIWLIPWDEDASVRHVPWATWLLIFLNVLAYLFLSGEGGGDVWVKQWGLVPAEPHWYHFITANFVHGDLMHLVGNMLFLLVFGDNVEDAFGPLPFLALYFLGGLVGDAWFVSANAAMAIPSVGASGCIATLAGAYGVLFFSSTIGVRVVLLVFPVHKFTVAAPLVLLFWFGADVFRTFAHNGVLAGGGGVNFVAHGAGFAVGVVVAAVALAWGVGRRYEGGGLGHAWFGYWPDTPAKPRRRLPAR
jgi:membrane associated rhomboid family serine protease